MMNSGRVGKVVKNIVTGRHSSRDRDGLSNVEGGCVQNNNSEKQRRRLRKIQCVEDIDATVGSGAACFHEICAMTFQSDRVPRAGEARYDVQDSKRPESCA